MACDAGIERRTPEAGDEGRSYCSAWGNSVAFKPYIPGPEGGVKRLAVGNGSTADTIAVSSNPLADAVNKIPFRTFSIPVSTRQQTIGTNSSGQPVTLGAQTAAELKALFNSTVQEVRGVDWAKWAGLATLAIIGWVIWKSWR